MISFMRALLFINFDQINWLLGLEDTKKMPFKIGLKVSHHSWLLTTDIH